MARLSVLLLLGLLAGLPACEVEPRTPVESPADVQAAAVEPVVERQLTVAPDPGQEPAPAPVIAVLAPRRDRVPFRIGAGYGALGRIDFSGCLDRGLPVGYLRLRATFSRIGSVVHASVETRDEPPPAALDCIAEELRQTGVPAFDGAEVRLSRTYFVSSSD